MPPDEHEKPSTSILKERRFKLSRACDRCRRRRIKCDEGHPCQACISASSACTFEEPGKRAHPHKSKRTATLEDRMHHLETLIQAIPPAVFAASTTASPDSAGRSSPEPNASPLAPFMTSAHTYPSGIPPPSLHVFPLTNPSTHFTESNISGRHQSPNRAFLSSQAPQYSGSTANTTNDPFAEELSTIPPLLASYLYFDDEGYTRWQGETSGLPLLDLLVERQSTSSKREASPQLESDNTSNTSKAANATPSEFRWLPNRIPRRTDVNPETLWRLITSHILPELMDSLVQCFLSTTHYLIPFLHVPSFLADYGNPQKWGEPGFAAFIVSICCVASRHIDDQRVRADPTDGITAGTQWFELLGRLRTLPIADRPTLYTIQADLVAAVYAVGLGRLSRAAALLSEAVTVCIDAGLHRTADSYDLFDPIEDEVRKRTFWCVYMWDKQLSAHFGRPPMIRLKDCDVSEPAPVDDEFITHEGLGIPPPGTESKMSVFLCALRMSIVLESVVDVPPTRHFGDSSPFLMRATSVLSRSRRRKELLEEEAMLDDIHQSIQPYWAHTRETLASDDVIRVTQAVRLHCAEQLVRLFIYRHRFSELVTERTNGNADEEPSDMEKEATASAQNSALQIISAHLYIATKGMMTYYGVHVIHQLTQAGRTLIAILLNCKSESMQRLIPPSLDALRSCVSLLRRFSSRYVCGVRCQAGELLEEFCQLTRIPLEPSSPSDHAENTARPPWIRPVPRRVPTRSRNGTDSPSQHSSPEGFSPSEFFSDITGRATSPHSNGSPYPSGPSAAASGHHSPIIGQGSAPQYINQHSNNNGSHPGPLAPFMDTSGEMVLDMMNPADAQMYMSSEVMALFNGGAVDVASLFLPEFQQKQQQQATPVPGRGSFHGTPFQKMTGSVMSP